MAIKQWTADARGAILNEEDTEQGKQPGEIAASGDYDITSKIDENRVEYVQNLLSELHITQLLNEDEFDYEQLIAKLKEELHFIVKVEDIKSEDYEALENSHFNTT